MALNGKQTNVGGNANNYTNASTPKTTKSFSLYGSSLFSKNSGNVGLAELVVLITDLIKSSARITSEYDVQVKAIDRGLNQYSHMKASFILFMMKPKTESTVYFTTMIVHSTYSGDDSIQVSYQNQYQRNKKNVDVGMVYDRAMVEICRDVALATYTSNSALTIIPSPGVIIPKYFDKTNETAVKSMIWQLVTACRQYEIITNNCDNDFTFKDFSTERVKNALTFGDMPSVDTLQHPVRSNVHLAVTIQNGAANVQENVVNNGSTTADICSISGFTDIVYTAPVVSNMYNTLPHQQIMQPPYAARLVLTNIDFAETCSPSLLLLAMYASLYYRENNNWYTAFLPDQTKINGKQIDLTDIGALGYETLAPGQVELARVETRTSNFQGSDLARLLSAWFYPGCLISIDVPYYGSSAFYLENLRLVSEKDKAATDVFINSIDTATGGNFSQYWNRNNPIFIEELNLVHLGYYTDHNGARRDIRDIDYLAIANLLGDQVTPQHNPIQQWSETFYQSNRPIDDRLSDRLSMIKAVTNNSYESTGLASRLTFSEEFLQAFASAVRASGLTMQGIINGRGAELISNRGTGLNWVTAGLNKPAATSMFNNYGGNVNTNTYSRY